MAQMAKFLIALFLFFLLSSTALFGAMDRAELRGLHSEGEASFRQANELTSGDPEKARSLYEKALLSFETIAREGPVQSGKLFYNIGNVYFRLGDLGRAILNYRKAEGFIPGDANLQQNLMYARSRCADRIDPKPQTRVLQTIFFWHFDLSPYARSVLFVVFFDFIWIFAGIYLFWKRPWLKNMALAFAVAGILLAGSLSVEAFQQAQTRHGVILAKEVVARKGDSLTYEPSFKEPLHAGAEFTLIEERKGWYQVELADGRRCWIPAPEAGLI